jgi:hypothetical protein
MGARERERGKSAPAAALTPALSQWERELGRLRLMTVPVL